MLDADALVEAFTAYGLSRKTIVTYLGSLRRADRELDVDTVGAVELRDYADTLPMTRSSRALLRSALLAYWRVVGRLDGPAAAIVVPARARMRCRALDDPRAHALARAAVGRHDDKGLAVLFALYSGLRRNEIATLRWRQVDAEGWVTIVGKGDVTRTLPLHPRLAGELEARRPDGRSPAARDWVFPGRWGGPTHPTTLWGWVRDVAREAGLTPVAPHVLRHTALATALDGCGDLRAVQELAGHARPETTAGYTRVTARRLLEAVESIDYGEESEAV